jgi:hypothetical protein
VLRLPSHGRGPYGLILRGCYHRLQVDFLGAVSPSQGPLSSVGLSEHHHLRLFSLLSFRIWACGTDLHFFCLVDISSFPRLLFCDWLPYKNNLRCGGNSTKRLSLATGSKTNTVAPVTESRQVVGKVWLSPERRKFLRKVARHRGPEPEPKGFLLGRLPGSA